MRNNVFGKFAAVFCAAVLLFSAVMPASAAGAELTQTCQDALALVPQAQYGNEWFVVGLCAAGAVPDDEYLDAYAQSVNDWFAENTPGRGQHTIFSKCALALTAAGLPVSDVILAGLNDYEQAAFQGPNGPAYALLALDSGAYDSDQREAYVQYLLGKQMPDGGWAIFGDAADPDTTAIVLQALAPYRDDAAVSAAVDTALGCLGALQLENGGFSSMGYASSESCAQVLIALCALQLDVSHFTSGGCTALDALMQYKTDGGFAHVLDGEMNARATEQALIALAALEKAAAGKFVYDFTPDEPPVPEAPEQGGTAPEPQPQPPTDEPDEPLSPGNDDPADPQPIVPPAGAGEPEPERTFPWYIPAAFIGVSVISAAVILVRRKKR